MRLTFDDGPGPETEQLLDVLDEYDEKATFFLVGDRVQELPDVAARVVEEGHTVGNHSMTHPRLTDLSPSEVAAELDACSGAVWKETGVDMVQWRAPYGAVNAAVLQVANEVGLLYHQLWDVEARDWEGPPSQQTIVDRLTNALASCTVEDPVVLLHDGPRDRLATVEAVHELLWRRKFSAT